MSQQFERVSQVPGDLLVDMYLSYTIKTHQPIIDFQSFVKSLQEMSVGNFQEHFNNYLNTPAQGTNAYNIYQRAVRLYGDMTYQDFLQRSRRAGGINEYIGGRIDDLHYIIHLTNPSLTPQQIGNIVKNLSNAQIQNLLNPSPNDPNYAIYNDAMSKIDDYIPYSEFIRKSRLSGGIDNFIKTATVWKTGDNVRDNIQKRVDRFKTQFDQIRKDRDKDHTGKGDKLIRNKNGKIIMLF